jgi:hypothetical protein
MPFPATPEIPIVLTATITPNVAGVSSGNSEERLAEYEKMVTFCQKFAPVIFLENSNYPLQQHAAFAETSRLRVYRFSPSFTPEFGKGFQEFEMLDAWLANEPEPPARWLKITGRYHLTNLNALLNECRREQNYSLLIDQLPKRGYARTHLFCTTTAFYLKYIKGLYRQCDDRKGDWIEYVLFRRLQQLPKEKLRAFKTQPDFIARLGSTGRNLPSGGFQWLAKQCLRRINHLVDERHLFYVR